MINKISETDLFNPIKNYFLKNGYKVQAEVKNCDIVCLKDNELIVVEIKKSFNLKVLYQAIDRKNFSNNVYIAIQYPKNILKKEIKYMIEILKNMGIGLIFVYLNNFSNQVEIVLTPTYKNISKNSKKRKNILKEFESRNLQTNLGGSSYKKEKILTAYKEKVIYIACVLNILKKASPKQIREITKIENTSSILRLNYSNYFCKLERGVYSLSDEGKNLFLKDDFKEAIEYYEKEVNKSCLK